MEKFEDAKKPEEDQSPIPLTVELSGGLELLFDNERKLSLSLPSVRGSESANISYLVEYLCNNMMTDSRRDMFILDGSIRPGILVLINDADWELEGGPDYEIQPRDNILFVSTLHGG